MLLEAFKEDETSIVSVSMMEKIDFLLFLYRLRAVYEEHAMRLSRNSCSSFFRDEWQSRGSQHKHVILFFGDFYQITTDSHANTDVVDGM